MIGSKYTQLDRLLAIVVVTVPPCAVVVAAMLACIGVKPTRLDLILALSMYFLSFVGIELGYHRYFAHRSFETFTHLSRVLAVLGSMAFQGPVLWWVAIHRKHHQFSDHVGDPHSPNLHPTWIRGLVHAHGGWLFDKECVKPREINSYVVDLIADRNLMGIHIQYTKWLLLGLLIPVAGTALWSGYSSAWRGLLYAGLVRICVVNHLVWAVNSLSHRIGRIDFEVRDHSRNIWWLAILSLGQGWHNNHHAFPTSAILRLKWWQVDIGGLILRTLEFLRLVWRIKTPSNEQLARKSLLLPDIGDAND